MVSVKIFSCFSYKPIADTRGMVGRIKGATIHCYTQNIKALDFVVSERNTLMAYWGKQTPYIENIHIPFTKVVITCKN